MSNKQLHGRIFYGIYGNAQPVPKCAMSDKGPLAAEREALYPKSAPEVTSYGVGTH
jgi:hypothetical protein